MLRELIDIALHEDFTRGLARSLGLRVSIHDRRGEMITAADPLGELCQSDADRMKTIPTGAPMTPVPAHDPPGMVAFVENHGAWYVAAPVYVDDQQAGWVAIGEFREQVEVPSQWRNSILEAGGTVADAKAAWERLPILNRDGSSHVVIAARWGARLLAEWCRRESQLLSATEEAALVGDIAELLTGREELQAILDQIVSDTARVMRCRFCSLRLYDPKNDQLRIKAVHNLSDDYLGKGTITRSRNPIDDEALDGTVVYVEDVGKDPRIQYPEQMQREGIVSQLTAGMIYHGQPVGVIRVYTAHRRRFRKTQRNLLRAVAHQAATAIVHARLIAERLRSAETERQLTLAGDLQNRMMRGLPPRHDGLATASVFQPSSHLGGDFCDLLTICDGRLAAVVADVVGKGIPASLLSASTQGALRAMAQCCMGLGDVMTRLNLQVWGETQTSEFATCLIMAFDAERRKVSYCSAGHEPPLLLRDGRVRRLTEGDLVLGISSTEVYQVHDVDLQVGDTILLFTDGAIDAMNFDDELFGRERLQAGLISYGDLDIDQVLKNLVWDIRRFIGLAEQSDDLTMVGVRIED
ncbi:MAG: GAF domain-containing SpoIIE family protein phosphatase [Planctomycetota bacterium]